MFARLLSISLASAVLVGCAPQMPVRHKRYLAAVAAKDLRCPKGQLSYRVLARNHYRVSGCNGKVEYTVQCDHGGVCTTTMITVPNPIVRGGD